MKLSVVIPVYNEENSIASTLQETFRARDELLAARLISGFEVIAVNDASTDSSLNEMKKFLEQGLKILDLKSNHGYGGALKKGFESAKGELIAFYDADGTYPVAQLPELVEELVKGKNDLVIGARASTRESMQRKRLYANRALNIFLSSLTKSTVSDSASGMRVFRSHLTPKLFHLPSGLEFTPAMTAMAVEEGHPVKEVPVNYFARVGTSKLNYFRHGPRFFFSVVDQVKLYNPLKLFGFAGAFLFLCGLFNQFLVSGNYFLTLAFLLSGLNLFFFGFLANFAVKLFYNALDESFFYRWAFNRYLLAYFNLAGLFLMIVGGIISLFSYPAEHWISSFAGLLLVLIGVQLLLSSLLVKIIKELYDKRVNARG